MPVPINWTGGGGHRNANMDAIITELIRQANENGHTAYARSSVEDAVQAIAEVGTPQTIDSYVRQIGQTEAFEADGGTFRITDEAFDRYEEVNG